jgi:hypothetical protein
VSRLEQAKAELERALVGPPRAKSGQLELVTAPVRYGAISVMQPWAWLIAHAREWPAHVLGKTIENRKRPTNYRGPVLIHVSRRWEKVRERLAELRRLGLIGGACPEPPLAEMRGQLGQVIAVGELVGCRRVGSRDPHPWGIAGSWGWELADVELVRPFGLRGNTGLWYAPPHVRVRKLVVQHELGGLPAVGGLGLRVDPGSGRVWVRVPSLVEAVRVVLRAGVRDFDYALGLDGEVITAGELLARAAEEHGEPEAAARLRRVASVQRARAVVGGGVDRGPRLHGCELVCRGLRA